MIATVLFLAAVGTVAAWWMSRQRLMAKPWLEQGVIDEPQGTIPVAKIGLGVLIAALGSLFALFISAYSMRMQYADWWALPVPALLWVNTGLLLLSSVALQAAKRAADRWEIPRVKIGLLTAGGSASAFVAGQLLAWWQLAEAGYGLAGNPANSFFYLVTGLHGLHVLGGLVALGRTMGQTWRGDDLRRVKLSVALCAIYWHFLLFVWLVLFALLMSWAGYALELCRQLLS
jgi:cytochrome c oxidase subunit III